MAEQNLIMTSRVIIDDMYDAMEYLNRHLDSMSFSEMHKMVTMIDGIEVLLKKYVTEETKDSVKTVFIYWSQLKIKTQRALMNSRVCLA